MIAVVAGHFVVGPSVAIEGAARPRFGTAAACSLGRLTRAERKGGM